MGKIVSQQELAELFGKSVKTITSWQKDGTDPMPCEFHGRRGKSNQYDTEKCIGWYVRRELSKLNVTNHGEVLDLETERTRLAKAQADAYEIKNAISRNESIEINAVGDAIADVMSSVASILDSIPLKVKNRVPSLTASELEIVTREIVKCRNAASKLRFNV